MRTRIILAGIVALTLGAALAVRAQMGVSATSTAPAAATVSATQANAGPKVYTATSLPARLDISLDGKEYVKFPDLRSGPGAKPRDFQFLDGGKKLLVSDLYGAFILDLRP